MLRLWGRITSINVRKAAWALQECGVPFERIDAGLAFGIVKTPPFLAKNPNGLVPLLEDGDFLLWESNVIVRYVCSTHAMGTLCPSEPKARYDAERWMDWQQTTLQPATREGFMQLYRTPKDQQRPELIAQSVAASEPLLARLDEHLARHAYVAGDRFTMGDIPVACEVDRYWKLPFARGDHPNLRRWHAAIVARPATRGVLDIPLG